MQKERKIESVLRLNKLVFDKIEFKRNGFKNENEIEFQFETRISEYADNRHKVTLVLNGNKKDEYTIEISLSGFFTLEENENLDKVLLDSLVRKNSVAILMPYLRSELSILTAQPDMECIVLPAFNINNMLDE